MQDMTEATEVPIEPETPPALPPGSPEPTPEAIAEEEAEESDGADWDAMDLDEIALPGQKSAKELAAEKVPCTASGKATAESLWSSHSSTGCTRIHKVAVATACAIVHPSVLPGVFAF